MLDSTVRKLIDPTLNTIARLLAKCGIGANTLTIIGFIFSVLGFITVAFQAYGLTILFIALSRTMDGLDGPLARQTKATDFGGYLDIVLDFIFYAGTVFFFAVGQPSFALPAAFLIFSFMGTGSSFLAYAIMAEKHDINHDKQGKKSFFYLQGLTEGTETILVIILICFFPSHFDWIAYIFGALCWLTTIGRIRQAAKDFKDI
ncbi:MAG: CDP-alcohol phosphatidyltransferase [Alphaproteobacteria bacterium CG1_02_46_17]|nr:MAG: CDP-alcohol phosphatidyltransferase [Alphaproteobacteria bacterium CG1_02_46_17]